MRVTVAEALLSAGFEREWVSKFSNIVSQVYARTRTPYPIKDERGIAIYDQYEDRDGLVIVACDMRIRQLQKIKELLSNPLAV